MAKRTRRCWQGNCPESAVKWGMCSAHLQMWLDVHPRRTTEDRFWSYVRKVEGDGCWFWMGALDSNGYGIFNVPRDDGKVCEKAHRYSYLLTTGEVAGDLHLDHLCRMRPCVRPDHLELVTAAENNRRKPTFRAVCPNGHEMTGGNVRELANGRRRCNSCADARREREGLSDPEEIAARKRAALEKRRESYTPTTGVRGSGRYQAERTHCSEGHPYEGDNLIMEKRKRRDGSTQQVRRCRACVNAKARDNHAKRKIS